jgi:hypothetical protein
VTGKACLVALLALRARLPVGVDAQLAGGQPRRLDPGRPHRSLAYATPVPWVGADPMSAATVGRLHRRDVLGGLIHEYECAA